MQVGGTLLYKCLCLDAIRAVSSFHFSYSLMNWFIITCWPSIYTIYEELQQLCHFTTFAQRFFFYARQIHLFIESSHWCNVFLCVCDISNIVCTKQYDFFFFFCFKIPSYFFSILILQFRTADLMYVNDRIVA